MTKPTFYTEMYHNIAAQNLGSTIPSFFIQTYPKYLTALCLCVQKWELWKERKTEIKFLEV